MKPRFFNQSTSSFLLWLDHELLQKGSGFENVSSYFYDTTTDPWSNLYTYSSPYGGFTADQSVDGATIMSGVYVSGVFSTTGQNHLTGINYDKGELYFDQPIDPLQISGTYALKEFGVIMNDKSEADLLFETSYRIRPYTEQMVTGLDPNEITYPVVIVRRNSASSEPFAFGGQDLTQVDYRCIILAENAFQRDAAVSILTDSARSNIGLIEESEMPYNYLGDVATGSYNYTALVAGKSQAGNSMFIDNTSESAFNINVYGELKGVDVDRVSLGIVDVETSMPRYPRQS